MVSLMKVRRAKIQKKRRRVKSLVKERRVVSLMKVRRAKIQKKRRRVKSPMKERGVKGRCGMQAAGPNSKH